IISYPLSKPTQLLLDKLFGKSSARLTSRRELGMLIGEHIGDGRSELDEDEVEIMRGALTLSKKRVRDIMTDIDHVYWLKPETVMNRARLDEIKANNWSRIPIFNKRLNKVRGI